jgi:predicted DNA-binding transcriptional regulator AlpA
MEMEKLYDRTFISLQDLIETLQVSQSTIYRLCDSGELNKFKSRGTNFFMTEEVISYIDRTKGLITVEGGNDK